MDDEVKVKVGVGSAEKGVKKVGTGRCNDTCTLAHLHTCTLAHLHTCTLA